MGEWKEYKLGDITTEIGDGIHGTPNYSEDGEFYFINGNNISNGKVIIKGDTKRVNRIEFEKYKKLLSNRTILLSINGTIGNVGFYNNEKCILGKSACYFNLKDNVDKNFVYYTFLTDDFQSHLLNIATGTTIQNVPLKGLRESIILLPPLDEQIRIASILSSLDDKIDLLHRENKTLEAMAETLFRQWFIEEAKEDWEEGKLGDFVSVIDNRGKTPPYTDNITEYPIIEVNALTGTERYVKYNLVKKYVEKDIYDSWFRGYFRKYDIFVSTVGSIGELAMCLEEKGVIAQNVIALHANNISPFYLYQYLNYNKDDLKGLDIGSVQPSIKVPHLLNMSIIIPPHDKLKEYDIIMLDIIEKEEKNIKQIQTLIQQRDSLLPKLMNNEINI